MTLLVDQDELRTHPEVWDGLGYLPGGPGQVGGPSGRTVTHRGPSRRSGMHRVTLLEVRDGLEDTPGGLGRVGGPSERTVTHWGTLPKVLDWLGDTPCGPGRVG